MQESTNEQVQRVSDFIQDYMSLNSLDLMTADHCAELLAKNKILPNTIGPKPGFNFRQMLREGRDNNIDLVKGAFQERPNTKWEIHRQD